MADNSDHMNLDGPELEHIKHQSLALEKLFDMSATFESYVDHVQKFPDRVTHFATGGGCIAPDEGDDLYVDEVTDDQKSRYSRASMLLNPGMAAILS